jgi:hypothetical protein
MSSFRIRLAFVAVGLAGFALGAVVRGDGVQVGIDGKSIVVVAGGQPLLVVGGSLPGKEPLSGGFSVKEAERLALPRDAFGRVVVFQLNPVSWCNSDVCEPCKPGAPEACTIVHTPLFNPILGAVLEPPIGTPSPTPDPFEPTATPTATPTAQSIRDPKP